MFLTVKQQNFIVYLPWEVERRAAFLKVSCDPAAQAGSKGGVLGQSYVTPRYEEGLKWTVK